MILVVAYGRYLIALVTDPVPGGGCLVTLVTDPVAPFGHLVTFIGQTLLKPLRRPGTSGSPLLMCLVAFVIRVFTPVARDAAALICSVAFVIGQVPVFAGGDAFLPGPAAHADGLGAFLTRLVMFLAGEPSVTIGYPAHFHRSSAVGTGFPTLTNSQFTLSLPGRWWPPARRLADSAEHFSPSRWLTGEGSLRRFQVNVRAAGSCPSVPVQPPISGGIHCAAKGGSIC
jgi:hypothetical protein